MSTLSDSELFVVMHHLQKSIAQQLLQIVEILALQRYLPFIDSIKLMRSLLITLTQFL